MPGLDMLANSSLDQWQFIDSGCETIEIFLIKGLCHDFPENFSSQLFVEGKEQRSAHP
jgi:hypothetical protein